MSTRGYFSPSATNALARLFEVVHEGVYLGSLDASGSATVAANPHLKLMFGYAADAPDTSVRPFDPDRFVDPQIRATLLERLERDGAVSDFLLRLRRADGQSMWVELTAHAERDTDANTNALQIDALLRDVSERKRLEDQARDLYHQLLQAEKMAVLGQTISGVAHELNNPLASILTWAERLSKKPANETIRQGLDTILHEAERAARIVRHLLTFARKRHTTRTMVDVNQVARETLTLRQHEQHLANVIVVDALAAGLPQVFADPHQLQQVILNLVINAEQAMVSANGRGTLVARTWHEMERDVVLLELADDGPGIPEEVASKIFDPFFTTKDVGKGTGLGLTVAYAIIQEHGGSISVHSSPGAGAAFRIELPTASVRARPAPAKPAVQDNVGAGAAVLVIEDEPALATAVAEGLTDAGFVVTRAADGEEGLERLREKTFDVIVCDLRMPRLDGPAFYRAIAASSPALARRVIFVTGDVAGTEAERFLEESGCRWLPKPFRLADLLRAARDVIG
jgi:two-component system cell cycle sensor histidine kinase/response regulator CckA